MALRWDKKMEMGDLEAFVLGVVRRLKKASTTEVLAEVRKTRNLAYSSVATTLDRLHKKGCLRRRDVVGRGGAKHVYSCNESSDLQKALADRTIDKLIDAFGDSMIPAIYKKLEEYPRIDLAKIKKVLSERRT